MINHSSNNNLIFLICVLLTILISPVVHGDVGCISDSGNAVDWFVLFKLNGGYSYAYADSRSPSLTMSAYTLDDDTNGAIAYTLSQAYGDDATAKNYALWNDEQPEGKKSTSRGHSKGFLAFDDNYGFWLVHSIPGFPAFDGKNYKGLEDSGKYGQTLFCTTHSTTTFNKIGQLLQSYFPYYYASNIEPNLTDKVSNLVDSLNAVHDTSTEYQTIELKSKAGSLFTAFGKPGNCKIDIYNQIISEHYSKDTYAESWMNGINPLPSYCTSDGYKYNTQNIRSLDISGHDYTETQDHSKWCLVKDTSTVCFGGLNRQASQQSRYGGFVCFEQSSLYKSVMDLITDMDQCTTS